MDSNIDPEVTGISLANSNNNNTNHNSTEEALNILQKFNQQETTTTMNNNIKDEQQKSQNSNDSSPNIYAYNPHEKPPRLGRPRRNINHTLSPPETSSSKNHNESRMSKFRLDSKPIEGSGSRGGKGGRKPPKGRITSESLKRQKQQSTLNFAKMAIDQQENQTKTKEEEDGDEEKNEEDQPIKRQKLILKLPPQKEVTQSQPKRKSTKKSNSKSISRTTVIYTRSKQSRQLPGPLVGLCYNNYDDNLNDPYFDSKNEKIALGYPIYRNPYAKDIIYIISFLLKFKDIIQLENNIGPNDFEIGLSLPIPKDETYSNEISNYSIKKETLVIGPDYDINYISIEMENLFKKLLTLVLNRKKDVMSFTKAIQELKLQSETFGLPKEWKSLQNVKDLKFPNLQPVDLNNSQILMDEVIKKNNQYITVFNPFYDSKFESQGLKGLENPIDRLILLRTLVSWCLIQSEIIKNHITTLNQNIDLPGERDTNYCSRSVLYGFKNCFDTKYEVEKKISKRKNEDDVKYIDPTSNPVLHPLSLRLNEQVIGDLGFKIGRFYLCRMSDEFNGGLTNVKKLQNILNGNNLSGNLPSNFKLYVQDVHQMLLESLSSDGIEFNSNGKEVKPIYKQNNEINNWYEVASNSKELLDFIEYLGKRLGLIDSTVKLIPMASLLYKSTYQFYEYLTKVSYLIQKQEELLENKKSTRRKPIDYSERRAVERLGLEADEIINIQENDDDEDENYVDQELVQEEDEEYAEDDEGDDEY